jgi:hypothetical protein
MGSAGGGTAHMTDIAGAQEGTVGSKVVHAQLTPGTCLALCPFAALVSWRASWCASQHRSPPAHSVHAHSRTGGTAKVRVERAGSDSEDDASDDASGDSD